MKSMLLSGVFVLASAGLATSGLEGPTAPDAKPADATLVRVTEAEVEAVIASKKDTFVQQVTQAMTDCTEDGTMPLCQGAETKN
ncbi:hypothetical protein [Roseicyclus marinus]|uniref:Secreted protein n=1 Tax=Roseicyclus marinus TaxID=2161673 RepID=A0AA48H4L5_9RHOB|nr:hypothetical protein MACH21_14390 [Roseicyclus marinus]